MATECLEVMPIEYPLTQLPQECATLNLSNYYNWENLAIN